MTTRYGQPTDRRRFMDTTLSQVDKDYLGALNTYEKILPQRNALLRRIAEKSASVNELSYWDDQLVAAGSVIIARNENYSLAGTLTRISGRHTLKFGGELRRLTHNYAQSNNAAGAFNFNNLFTSSNPFTPAGTGIGFASGSGLTRGFTS